MPEQLESIWNHVRDELRREVPDFTFHIWFDPLELAGVERPDALRPGARPHPDLGSRPLPAGRPQRAAGRAYRDDVVVEVVDSDWSGGGVALDSSAANEATPRLNPKYTFEQFVIGRGNRFAHAGALACAELPAQAYNPLFIHGRPGLGKTHLLHASGTTSRGSAPA